MTIKKDVIYLHHVHKKTHFLLLVQLCLDRLSLVRITPLFKYHKKKLVFDGSFSFYRIRLSQILPVIIALYIVLTEKIPF
jgi:hypothetical protein